MERAQDIIAEVLLTRPEISPSEASDLAAVIVTRLDNEAEIATQRREQTDGVR